MIKNNFKKIISEEYLINISKIVKNKESTVGNVYIVYGENNKYVLKIYDDLNQAKAMILLHKDLYRSFNIPKIIESKNNKGYVEISNSKYIVLYSFLDGVQIGNLNDLNKNIIKNIALNLRELHEKTKTNKYNLKEVPFCGNYNIERKSLLHFDLTKGNIFYNIEKDKIGIIDFDDAKYGPSVCDVAILIAFIFISKKRGINLDNINLFIDTYYNQDINLKLKEIKYIKDIVTEWVDYILDNNDFHTSLKESFEIKKKLIKEYM